MVQTHTPRIHRGTLGPMLALKNVTKTYGKTRVLAGASFEIRPKDCVCVVGEGGSGKSTLLKLLIRAEDPTSGTVAVDGVDVKTVPAAILQLYRRRLGVAHQEPMLLAHATAEENIALPLELFGAPASIVRRATDDLLKRLGLTDKAGVLARNLSMSERSLVGIARAIIAAPMIVIADEPLQHLDKKQATIVTELLRTMHANGTTIVLFSRSAETATTFGARTVNLANGTTAQEEKPAKHDSGKGANAHKILEETEQRLHSVMATPPAPPPKKTPPKGGKRIRITSIGSGL